MLRQLKRIHPNVDTILVCTDCSLLKYYIQTELEATFEVAKEYSVSADTAIMFRKFRSDAFVAPLLGEKWLITSDLDKVGIDTGTSLLNWNNGNGLTLFFTEKYMNFKKFQQSEMYQNNKSTVLSLYLGRFDSDDISYLYKTWVLASDKAKPMTNDLLSYLCKNYRYDVERVMDLFAKMRIGLIVDSKQTLIDEVGLGGVTPTTLTLDLLTIFQPQTGRFAHFNVNKPVTSKRIQNAQKKFITYLNDLSKKVEYRTILRQMRDTLLGIVDMKALILNGGYRKMTKEIPESFSKAQTTRLRNLGRYEWRIRDEVSLRRVYVLLYYVLNAPTTYDAELQLMTIIMNFIALMECEE